MNSIGDKGNFFKNPIGIIGIFLVLTEAIASVVIMKSTLNDIQNTILVSFIVLFPCLVLFVFYLLVTRHHEKLYSPSDYKDEQNFVNTYNSMTQKADLRKIIDGNEESEEITDKNIVLIKDALTDIIELQKKIIPTMESSVLSDDDKIGYVSNMDEYLAEIDEKDEEFKVLISPMYRSGKLVEQLLHEGYIASIYRVGLGINEKKIAPISEHEAIWLGDEVPVPMAINVIKIAKKYYPHLKYIQLNDAHHAPEFVKYHIFIGGSSNTAKERGLKVLYAKDFDRLYELNTKSELHNFVKKFANSH